MKNINLNIEQLHIHGLSSVSLDRLHTETEHELAQLIHKHGLPETMNSHRNCSDTEHELSLETLPKDRTKLAAAIAQHLYQQLSTRDRY